MTAPALRRVRQPALVRLMGTADECTDAVRAAVVPSLLEVSPPRPNRGDSHLVRAYIEARLINADGIATARGSR